MSLPYQLSKQTEKQWKWKNENVFKKQQWVLYPVLDLALPTPCFSCSTIDLWFLTNCTWKMTFSSPWFPQVNIYFIKITLLNVFPLHAVSGKGNWSTLSRFVQIFSCQHFPIVTRHIWGMRELVERKEIISMELGPVWVWGAGDKHLLKAITYSCILVNIIVQYKFHQSGIP